MVWAFGRTAIADGSSMPTRTQTLASAVVDIDALCDRLAASTKDGKRPRLFATISEDGKPAAIPWREYASDDELRARLQVLGTYEVAEFWKQEDGAVYVQTTATSDTGDWAHFVHYCYRPDGTLARTKFTMNSFVVDDGIRGIRIRYFATDGRQIRSRSETRVLETDKKRTQRNFDEQEPLYKTVSALPFARLLQ